VRQPPDTAEARRGFLGDLHDDEIAIVLSHTQARLYAAGELAVRQGERDRSIFIISRGSFEVLIPGPHGPRQVRILEQGDLFGEVAFFDGRPRSADVVALEGSEALTLTQASFQKLRLVHPRLALYFALDLGRILAERFRASDALVGPADG
jgi:CRP-like cAMP-binding protein